MRLLRAVCFLMLASVTGLTTAPPASAGEPRTHDGFFLRLAVGAGTASTKLEQGGQSLEFSGTSGGSDIAIGGVVAPNLALHATMFGWILEDPKGELTGPLSGSNDLNGRVMMSAFGVGLTYYMMPANMYFTGSIGTGAVTFDLPQLNADETSDNGFAFALGVGKEWWVGNSWGLGLSGNFMYNSSKDATVSENWTGPAFDVRFSATFN